MSHSHVVTLKIVIADIHKVNYELIVKHTILANQLAFMIQVQF